MSDGHSCAVLVQCDTDLEPSRRANGVYEAREWQLETAMRDDKCKSQHACASATPGARIGPALERWLPHAASRCLTLPHAAARCLTLPHACCAIAASHSRRCLDWWGAAWPVSSSAFNVTICNCSLGTRSCAQQRGGSAPNRYARTRQRSSSGGGGGGGGGGGSSRKGESLLGAARRWRERARSVRVRGACGLMSGAQRRQA